jgi:hypothetical protein
MLTKKKLTTLPEVLDPELKKRLQAAAVPGFGPAFSQRVLEKIQPIQAPAQSIWNSLVAFSRPMLVTASLLALAILLLHLFFIDAKTNDLLELTDFSFDVLVADAAH